MNNKTEMTLEDLKEVLLENEVTNFDPVAEAFKVRRSGVCLSRAVLCLARRSVETALSMQARI